MALPRHDVYVPRGYQQITSLSAAVGLTVPGSGQPNAARKAMIQAEAQAVRWRDDGTNPTASVGYNLAAGAEIFYEGDLTAIKFIEVTASAKLNVNYYD